MSSIPKNPEPSALMDAKPVACFTAPSDQPLRMTILLRSPD